MIRGGGLKHVACAEDEDFIQALDKMMLENLQVHRNTNLNVQFNNFFLLVYCLLLVFS